LKLLFTILALLAVSTASGQFRFRDLNADSVQLEENGAPVYVYNYGMMLKQGVAADRTRCCYLHPVYAPNGVVITDDFPEDHPHHRGINWAWPVVTVDGKTYDLWTIKGMLAHFEKWNRKEAGRDSAVLGFQDGWYIANRKVAEEKIEIVAHPTANGRRDLDFTVSLRAIADNVSIRGTDEGHKGYGGFNIRFAPRTSTRIDTATLADTPDSDLKPNQWAELTGQFAGKIAGARITIDPSNPASPNGWCLRHYGFLGVDYPGLEAARLDTKTPLVLKFRVTLLAGATQQPKDSILVYTRNYTPDGKGYVHDNIADSVAALRKMGAENGFNVDATDDPNFFTTAKLQQYKAVVFSNSNNEAFSNDRQREAFKQYIEHGGGFVGIHSASGSEREWPYFWEVLGGKFLYHPKLQPFTVRVADHDFAATQSMPASFPWEDECYHIEYLNPDLHPLLVTDPSKLDDPQRAKHPFTLVGDSMPLAWYMQYDGGREFYCALGHKKEHYNNPILYQFLLNGIRWAMGSK
jgi:type 1 glutamine amidotransferase